MDLPERIQAALDRIPRWSATPDMFRVLVVGAGNGHVKNASSFLLACGSRLVWVDPAPRPHETLGVSGIHWDDVTDLLVTHTHEDHMGGLTACLARARDRGRCVSLWMTQESFEAIQARLARAVPHLPALVEWHEIVPGRPADIGSARFDFRLNHHNLPSGTLGLKVSSGGRSVGISGDTKYDETLLRRLNRPELEAAWFRECHLLFHEIDLARPHSVHSYYPEVLKLAQRLAGRTIVYHTVGNTTPLEMATEGQWYAP
jgi:ribonuclease BN (tRNA processing enzyme)